MTAASTEILAHHTLVAALPALIPAVVIAAVVVGVVVRDRRS